MLKPRPSTPFAPLAGLNLPSLKVRTDLGAGRWCPELKSWFRSLLEKKQLFSGLFVAYLELLRDCNGIVFLAVEYGFEMAVRCLGHSCITACDRSVLCSMHTSCLSGMPQRVGIEVQGSFFV